MCIKLVGFETCLCLKALVKAEIKILSYMPTLFEQIQWGVKSRSLLMLDILLAWRLIDRTKC